MSGLDRRLEAAFAAQAGRLWRALAIRVLIVGAALAAAIVVAHWAAWLAFGLIVLSQGLVAALVPWVVRSQGRFQRRLAAEPAALVWVHAGPDARSGRHRVELYLRDDESVHLHLPEAMAEGVVEAARAMAPAPTITTDDAGHAEAAPRHRLAGKLVRLEAAVRAAKAPGLERQAAPALATIAAWRERLFVVDADPYRGGRDEGGPVIASPRWRALPIREVEAQIDELLLSYAAAGSSEGYRKRMEALVKEKGVPVGLVRSELFK